jgi:hypothetical protein
MTTKVRTLISIVVVGVVSTLAASAFAESVADVCTGVPAKERTLGLQALRDEIVSVTPLNEFRFAGKAKYSQTEGVVIKLRATPGASVPWLERVNGCHVAMAGSERLAGNNAAEDPFILPGTTVRVSQSYAGYVVTVTATNPADVQKIQQRSYAMISASGGSKMASLAAH